MISRLGFKHTIVASYIGYFTQSILVCFVPLLFVNFNQNYDISLTQITSLITINFIVQLFTDFVASKIVDKIGYKPCVITAHILSALGLVCLAFLPSIFPPYIGLVISVIIYAIGGGLIEVLISPIVEACPSDNKSSSMSLLHSFYCWGVVATIVLSTLFFELFSVKNWQILACIWALVPLFNSVYFYFVPINTLVSNDDRLSIKNLFKTKNFWLFIVLMMSAGASEQAMSQWSSAFAESGLAISKTLGDLLGPCLFAILMGVSRVFYAKFSEKIDLEWFIVGSAVLCVISYLITSLSPLPILSLISCGICGLAVGIMWPGTLSVASKTITNGGTTMFAYLALAGDLGCALGPTVVGGVSSLFGGNLLVGILFAIIFPVITIVSILFFKKNKQ